jgi:hypothetical protein
MNTMLKTAYAIGAQQAEQDFEKEALGYDYDYDSMNQGAFPPELMQLMQSPYGQAVQQGAEQGPQMKEQLATAMRGVGGGVAGGVGGAALGGALGYGGGHLANLLGADLDDDQIRKIMLYSALAGGGLGAGAGGVGAGGLLGQNQGQ